MGVLLASHHRRTERSRSLLSLKDLLLVAFFVGIGDSGALTLTAVWLGLALLGLIPVQAALHVGLLRALLLHAAGFSGGVGAVADSTVETSPGHELKRGAPTPDAARFERVH